MTDNKATLEVITPVLRVHPRVFGSMAAGRTRPNSDLDAAVLGDAFRHLHGSVLSPDLSERLKGAAGFRNVAVHTHRITDRQVVSSILYEHLDDFRQYA